MICGPASLAAGIMKGGLAAGMKRGQVASSDNGGSPAEVINETGFITGSSDKGEGDWQ